MVIGMAQENHSKSIDQMSEPTLAYNNTIE